MMKKLSDDLSVDIKTTLTFAGIQKTIGVVVDILRDEGLWSAEQSVIWTPYALQVTLDGDAAKTLLKHAISRLNGVRVTTHEPPSTPTDDLLTIPEVAKMLRVSVRSVRRRIVDKTIPAFKTGGVWRIKYSDVIPRTEP